MKNNTNVINKIRNNITKDEVVRFHKKLSDMIENWEPSSTHMIEYTETYHQFLGLIGLKEKELRTLPGFTIERYEDDEDGEEGLETDEVLSNVQIILDIVK